jgi:hypothetical protein
MVAKRVTISQIIKRFHSVDRRIFDLFKLSFVAVSVPFLTKLVMLKTSPGAVDPLSIKQWAIVFVVMFAATSGLMYMWFRIFTRNTRSVETLKKNVVRAFKIALDESSLNPRNSNRYHERRNSKTSL